MAVPHALIAECFKEGTVVPFLGAGASLIGSMADAWKYPGAERLPTGGELRDDLAHLAGLAAAQSGTAELATVAQYFDYVAGRSDLSKRLEKIFTVTHPYGKIHQYLAELSRPILVLTTNYDSLLEQAFEHAGKPFDLVVHQTSDLANAGKVAYLPAGATQQSYELPNQLDLDCENVSVIYKMHGTAVLGSASESSFVITEDDYVDFLTATASVTPIPSRIREEFEQRHLLFLGYGLTDWNFRVVLGTLRNALKKRTSWAIKLNATPVEQAIWESRRVLVFDMPIDDFVDLLRQ